MAGKRWRAERQQFGFSGAMYVVETTYGDSVDVVNTDRTSIC